MLNESVCPTQLTFPQDFGAIISCRLHSQQAFTLPWTVMLDSNVRHNLGSIPFGQEGDNSNFSKSVQGQNKSQNVKLIQFLIGGWSIFASFQRILVNVKFFHPLQRSMVNNSKGTAGWREEGTDTSRYLHLGIKATIETHKCTVDLY